MKVNLRCIMSLIVILGVSVFTANAQTVHQITEGTDVLKAAIDAAAPGDIIELISDGGVYLSNDQIVVDKDLIIRGHEDLEAKPVLKYVGTSTSAYMFKIEASPRFEVRNLEFDGDGTAEGGADLAKYALRLDNADTLGTMQIIVDNCVMHDFNEKIIKPYADCGIDSLVVRNSIFYNGAKEGIVLFSGSSGDPAVRLKYAEFINCTFYGFVREAIKGDTNPDTKLLVDHCTFYDCGGPDKPFIFIDDLTDVVIKNSIFQRNNETGNCIRLESDENIVNNCIIWDVNDWEIDNTISVFDTLHADPLFADPVNGDFTLGDGSPAIGFADDGKAAGDLRWDPTVSKPVVHVVEAGIDVLKPVIDAAASGDTIELVTSGGLYLSSDQIVLDKDLVIRGREQLAEKPVLKYIGTSTSAYMFKVVESPGIELLNLEFDGDGTAEGAAALAKYALRLDNADPAGTMQVLVENCVMHDFNEKIIKPYADCGIDSLLVRNSIFYNGIKEGIVLYTGSSSDPAVQLEYGEFVNCTFFGFAREAIKADTNPDIKMLVDHCTFYDCGGSSKGLIYVDDLLDVEVKNSIFVKNGYPENFARLESDDNSFHHNVIFDVASWDVDNSSNVSDTLRADPMFADAANMDFTLAAGSPARTAAEGGTPAGDLRWAIDPNAFLLTIITTGNGIVTMDPPGGVYDPGTTVTLTAAPDLGWKLDRWEGVVIFPPDKPTVTITMDSDKTVTAHFVSLVPKVELVVDTLGLGHVELDPEPVDGVYEQGAAVTLTAVPQADWQFVEWLGDITGSENPVTVNVDSNMHITASFMSTITQFLLNVEVVGLGSVSALPQPVLTTYDSGAVVELTAAAAIGWDFSEWTGDLTGSENPATVLMDFDKNITATFTEMQFEKRSMEIDTTWDLRDAVEFANNNSNIDSLILITSGGVYTSTSPSDVAVTAPLTIVAKEKLAEKPIVTNSDVETSNLDIFRVFDDFTLKGVVLDAGHERSHGMKYGIRLRNYPDRNVKWGSNITILDCDFIDFYEGKNPLADGHAVKIDVDVIAGTVLLENCTLTNFGYEAIRISDTEKWATDRQLDSLIVRNCTFTNIDAEGIRYYSDIDPGTPDAPVILEHLTFNNSATRILFLKNSGGAIVRDIIIANSRTSGHGRDGDLMDAQGVGTVISHIDTFNVTPVAIKASKDGTVDQATIYGIDPMFEDHENLNYTLLPESHLYGLGHDGEAIGDLNWATNDPIHVELVVVIAGEGKVHLNPMPVGKTYDPGQEVTLTAVPDSGWYFAEWSGALSGHNDVETLTMDAAKNVTATFSLRTDVNGQAELPKEYRLDQNFPNPFNPMTKINFALKEPGFTTLKVYDMLGREIATLVSQKMEAGTYKVIFNMPHLPSGVYFYKIQSGNFVAIKKMILMK